ncbi:MAG: sigma-70 family RNA polymerase sigma factor [Clostridia bacterium]
MNNLPTNSSELKQTAEYHIILAAKNGDSDAFDTLYKRYKSTIYGYISSLFIPLCEKDDLAQEGLIGLLKAVRSYDNASSSFATYASLCIKRSIISTLRKYNRNNRYELSADSAATSLSTEYVPSPEVGVVERESTKEWYRAFIVTLSPFEKKVFDLYIKGLSYLQMSITMSCSEKSIDNAMTRIKSKIKNRINH